MVAASIVTGVLAAVLVRGEIEGIALRDQASLKAVAVVVAARRIAANAALTQADVRVAMVPQGGRTAAAYSSVRAVLGLISRQTLYPGEQLLPGMLVTASSSPNLTDHVPPGMLAMSVLYNPVSQAGGALLPGDRVAVLAVLGRGYDGRKVDAAQLIMDRVPVLATPRAGLAAFGNAAGAGGSSPSATGAQSVILAVTPQQAERIAFASTYGQIELLLDSGRGHAISVGTAVTDSTVLP